MQILLTSAAFLIAAVCAGLMGYAIQRGATCTVAAVDEVVSKRRFNRLSCNGRGVDLGRRRACARRDIPPVGANAVGLPSELFDRGGRRTSGARRVHQSSLRVRCDRALRFRRVGLHRHTGWNLRGEPNCRVRFLASRARNVALRLARAGGRAVARLAVHWLSCFGGSSGLCLHCCPRDPTNPSSRAFAADLQPACGHRTPQPR